MLRLSRFALVAVAAVYLTACPNRDDPDNPSGISITASPTDVEMQHGESFTITVEVDADDNVGHVDVSFDGTVSHVSSSPELELNMGGGTWSVLQSRTFTATFMCPEDVGGVGEIGFVFETDIGGGVKVSDGAVVEVTCIGPEVIECGDNTAEGVEACDGSDLKGQSCASLNLGDGALGCLQDCSAFDTSDCSDGGRCGNGVRELPDETCDGADFGGADCDSFMSGYIGMLECVDCQIVATGCTSCGNMALDRPNEECDGDLLGGATCESEGFDQGGTLGCFADCTIDHTNCVPNAVCQDNVIEPGEQCEMGNLNGVDCTTVPNTNFGGGTLDCDPTTCQFDTSGCTLCQNGTIDTGEDCEDTDLNGADCTTIGMGFLSGTLACASDCSFDTSGCSTAPPICELDVPNAFSPRCAGPAVADGPFGCRFIQAGNNFAQWFESTSTCTPYGPQQLLMDSTDLHCQTHPDGGVGCWYRVPSVGVAFAQLDPMMLTLGTPIVHTNLSGGSNYLVALDTALGYGSWVGANRSISSDQLHAMTMMFDGTALQTFGPVSNVSGSITKSFARVEGTMLHVVSLVSGFSFQTPVISEAISINGDLTNGTFTSARAQIENVPTGADRGTWDAAMLADGRIRVFAQLLNTQTIGVTDHALGTLGGTSVQAIAIVGGTLLDFGVAQVPGVGMYLVAKVDIGGVVSLRAYPIPDMPAATLDVTGGQEIYAGDADVTAVVDGIDTVVLWANITSSLGHVISFPVP